MKLSVLMVGLLCVILTAGAAFAGGKLSTDISVVDQTVALNGNLEGNVQLSKALVWVPVCPKGYTTRCFAGSRGMGSNWCCKSPGQCTTCRNKSKGYDEWNCYFRNCKWGTYKVK
jgi:7-cyano-7-deazaguanine synthase in queuosine biosynthesis